MKKLLLVLGLMVATTLFTGTKAEAIISDPCQGSTGNDNCIFSSDIIDGEVQNGDIATDAVDSSKIADGSVTSADISDGTVTGTDISDGSVGSADITDASVTGSDIATGTVTGTNILDGTVDSADITAGAVTDAKITGPISASKITQGAGSGLDADSVDGMSAQDIIDAAGGSSPANVITVATSGGDYDSIVTALTDAACSGTAPGCIIEVAPGTYSENTINLKSYVTIKGSGHDLTTVSCNQNPCFSNSAVGVYPSVTVSDLLIDGNSVSGMNCFYLIRDTTYLNITNNRFVNCKNSSIYIGDGDHLYSNISDNIFSSAGQYYSIYTLHYPIISYSTISNNAFYNSTETAMYLNFNHGDYVNHTLNNNKISNNVFHDNKVSIFINASEQGVNVFNNNIDGNIISGSSQYGIVLQFLIDNTNLVTNNIINDNFAGIFFGSLLDSGPSAVVSNNNITNSSYAFYFNNYSSPLIIHNNLKNSAGYDIWLTNTKATPIFNSNTFDTFHPSIPSGAVTGCYNTKSDGTKQTEICN